MKLPRTYYNYISYLGSIIAIIAAFAITFFVIQINFFQTDNVYFDLFAYLVTPGFLVFGLILIPTGMYLKKRKLKKGLPVSDEKLLVINLRDPQTRNAILIFTVVTIFFVIATVIGSYKGFHYTESVEFCGKLCHKVMEPEYVAYQHSPHARVKCAECHVGEGADFYVKSKMSGLRQVYKYILGTYPRNIETPIANLRPARETCEKCHWPQKFYTNKIRSQKYYLADSANTEWDVIMKMRIGADHSALGNTEGIHWHINNDVEITYQADEKRQTIPWVRYFNKSTGKEIVFVEEDTSIHPTVKEVATTEKRMMDCMDCHNRPSHEYFSPPHYVNELFAGNRIDTKVPYLKSAAMEATNDLYTTKDSAFAGINDQMIKYYKEGYPALFSKYEKEIKKAVTAIQEEFSYNTFPYMRVSYKKYPRNIGHFENKGCFRCHDDKHKSSDGKVISKDCNLCHTLIGQGQRDSIKYSPINGTMPFIHPVDIGEDWKTTNCSNCHFEMF